MGMRSIIFSLMAVLIHALSTNRNALEGREIDDEQTQSCKLREILTRTDSEIKCTQCTFTKSVEVLGTCERGSCANVHVKIKGDDGETVTFLRSNDFCKMANRLGCKNLVENLIGICADGPAKTCVGYSGFSFEFEHGNTDCRRTTT